MANPPVLPHTDPFEPPASHRFEKDRHSIMAMLEMLIIRSAMVISVASVAMAAVVAEGSNVSEDAQLHSPPV